MIVAGHARRPGNRLGSYTCPVRTPLAVVQTPSGRCGRLDTHGCARKHGLPTEPITPHTPEGGRSGSPAGAPPMPEPERQERRSGSFSAVQASRRRSSRSAPEPIQGIRIRPRVGGSLDRAHLPCDTDGAPGGRPVSCSEPLLERLTAAEAGLELVPEALPHGHLHASARTPAERDRP